MELDKIFQGLGVSASALTAERVRMGIIATNIAHASDTDRGDGMPYRRKEAIFETVLEGTLRGGVQVTDIVDDVRTPMLEISKPGHPHANAQGMLRMPNVNPSYEMVDLITSSRAYEANLEAMQVMVKMAEQALELGR